MRFLKRTQDPIAPEHAAFATRLNAVTKRSKVEVSSCGSSKEPSKPQAMVQRFWTPQEAAENKRA